MYELISVAALPPVVSGAIPALLAGVVAEMPALAGAVSVKACYRRANRKGLTLGYLIEPTTGGLWRFTKAGKRQ